MRDSYTRYTWLIPTSDMKATTVANALLANIFCYFGIPKAIRSDNYNSFNSELLKKIAEQLKIVMTNKYMTNKHG